MDELVVTIKQGDLRGVETESVLGGTYISFKGIPYALPPVGDLRFKDPQPLQPWTEVRDASEEGGKCAQIDLFTKKFVGDDDCLYLNVSTTSLTECRPVMVWIHGGGFMGGDGGAGIYGPDYIVATNVVYVSINYRVGVLGFLHLDNEVAPGNMGLKDQVAALKWVKENIAQFGGDPNNVTIFGESAGGASVHYLLISPLTKELFHKAILQSGVASNPWASVSETIDVARRYSAALGKDSTDPDEIVEYLQTIPVYKLVEIQNSLQDLMGVISPFGPGVDDKSVEPFMPKPVQVLAAEGFDVPVIIGYNSHEGLALVQNEFLPAGMQEKIYENLQKSFESLVPRHLAEKAQSKVAEMAKEMRNFYFGDKEITKDLIEEYVQFNGDLFFGIGIHEVVEVQRKKKSPTYLYRFSYDSPNSVAKILMKTNHKGATHGEELFYLFHANLIPEELKMKPDSTEAIVRDRLVRLWTDFAKTGNPTPSIDDLITEKWEPVSKTSKNYLEIDAELTAGFNHSEEMWTIWQRIYAMADEYSMFMNYPDHWPHVRL